MTHIKPCPFCGQNVVLVNKPCAPGDGGGFIAFISCYGGGDAYLAHANMYAKAKTEELANQQVIEKWNTRAS